MKAGKITIDLSAGTAQFVLDMEKANTKLNEFGKAHGHAVSGVQATSAALRTLEGNMTNNLRAAERFLANTLNLGGALQKIFPVVGAIAFAGVISELVTKANEAYEAFKKLAEAPKRIAAEFQNLSAPVRVTNDELAVTNDRLANSIAKLQGKPQNGLALALDEARLASDKLAESLGKSLEAVGKLLQEESIGAFKGAFTGNASTSDLREDFKKLQGQLTDIGVTSGEKILSTAGPKAQAEIYKQATAQRKAAVTDYLASLRSQLKTAEDLQRKHDNPDRGRIVSVINGVPISERGASPVTDQASRISTLKGQLDLLQEYLRGIQLTEQNTGLTKQKDTLDAAAANAKLGAGPREKIAELRTQLAGVNAEVKAIGAERNPFAESLAKGAAAANKDLEALNKQLKETHQAPVNLAQSATIQNLERQIALGEANKQTAESWQKRLEEIQKLSADLALDMAFTDQKREESLKTLNEEVDAAQRLAAAERIGPEAARKAKNEIGLAKIDDPAIRDATRRKLNAEQDAQNEATIGRLKRQTAATELLLKAQRGSVDAQRDAEIATIRASGESSDVIEAQVRAQQAAWDLQDKLDLRTGSAMYGMHAYFEELANETHSAARQVHDEFKAAVDGINDELSRLMTGQKASWSSFFQHLGQQISKDALGNMEHQLARVLKGKIANGKSRRPMDEHVPGGIIEKIGGIFGGGAAQRDGNTAATALFVTLAGANGLPQWDANGQTPANKTTPGASAPASSQSGDTSAAPADKASQNTVYNGFRKLASFGSVLAHNLIGLGTSAASKGISDLASSGNDSSDGSTRTVGFAAGGRPAVGKLSIVGERGPELFVPDRPGTIIPNHRLKFGGARAFGGNVDPGNAYFVGERGPELYATGTGGGSEPTRHAAGGITNVYHIDNRGTDAAAAEQRTKAGIIAAHQSAIVTASRVMQERSARQVHKR